MPTPLLYPGAIYRPLTDIHYAPGTIAQRNTSVCHDTEGSTAEGAIATFAASPAGPLCTSSHLVIDRDGTIYQLVDFNNTAYHASQANWHSIGTEFVGLTANGAAWYNMHYAAQIAAGKVNKFTPLMATDRQYEIGAQVQAWLCKLMKIPCDRAHIRSHNEASPADRHVECCVGIMDLDKLVSMAQALV